MPRRFRFPPRLTAALLGLLLCGAVSAQDEIAIIVAKDAPKFQIDATILRDIYLKKIFINERGQAFVPVNLPPEHPLRRALTDSIFNKSAQQLQDYWNQRYFHGITPPYVLNSQEAVLQFVAKTPGAIGYIAPCRIDARVKLVLSIPAPPSLRENLEKLCNTDAEAAD
jgi:ABC-type phosphate transport system substrate-binding protein